MKLLGICIMLLASPAAASPQLPRSTPPSTNYTNPILPGSHPDPCCIFVPERDNTFFCATSSFGVFPGIPIHASKDLQHWKLISNAYNRPAQAPANVTYAYTLAATLRYHQGTFYLTTTYVGLPGGLNNIVLTTKDPYDDAAWSSFLPFAFAGIDTSLFWDDDGQAYVQGGLVTLATATQTAIGQVAIDLATGATGPTAVIYGAGTDAPEGPHMYKKDGYYYLSSARNGTALAHQQVLARATSVHGPFEDNPANPVLTNAGTGAYLQTVGHADLFQDAAGNWWGVALATRCGPEYETFPMGRETSLFPVTWDAGEWPVLTQVRSDLAGPLPPANRDIAGTGIFVDANDDVAFAAGFVMPQHFATWGVPVAGAYVISPPEHPDTLQLTPSSVNLTGSASVSAVSAVTFLGRRQSHTLFKYSVDLSFAPSAADEESGVTVFLANAQHLDLGIVALASNTGDAIQPYVRFQAVNGTVVDSVRIQLPADALSKQIRLQIEAVNVTHFSFSVAMPSEDGCDDGWSEQQVATAPGSLVSGGFGGTFVGVYATSNGGNGTTKSYVSGWRYTGIAQYLGDGVFVGPQRK